MRRNREKTLGIRILNRLLGKNKLVPREIAWYFVIHTMWWCAGFTTDLFLRHEGVAAGVRVRVSARNDLGR